MKINLKNPLDFLFDQEKYLTRRHFYKNKIAIVFLTALIIRALIGYLSNIFFKANHPQWSESLFVNYFIDSLAFALAFVFWVGFINTVYFFFLKLLKYTLDYVQCYFKVFYFGIIAYIFNRLLVFILGLASLTQSDLNGAFPKIISSLADITFIATAAWLAISVKSVYSANSKLTVRVTNFIQISFFVLYVLLGPKVI